MVVDLPTESIELCILSLSTWEVEEDCNKDCLFAAKALFNRTANICLADMARCQKIGGQEKRICDELAGAYGVSHHFEDHTLMIMPVPSTEYSKSNILDFQIKEVKLVLCTNPKQ